MLRQKSLSVLAEEQRELFHYRRCNFFIVKRKMQRILCDTGRISLYLMKNTDVQVGCLCNTS